MAYVPGLYHSCIVPHWCIFLIISGFFSPSLPSLFFLSQTTIASASGFIHLYRQILVSGFDRRTFLFFIFLFFQLILLLSSNHIYSFFQNLLTRSMLQKHVFSWVFLDRDFCLFLKDILILNSYLSPSSNFHYYPSHS